MEYYHKAIVQNQYQAMLSRAQYGVFIDLCTQNKV